MRGTPMGTDKTVPRLPTAQEILAQDAQEKSEAQRDALRGHLPKMIKNIHDNMVHLRRGLWVQPLDGIAGASDLNLDLCKNLLEENFKSQGVDYLVVEVEREFHSGVFILNVRIKKGSPLLFFQG
jgi:hypothetical protein